MGFMLSPGVEVKEIDLTNHQKELFEKYNNR